MTNTLAIATNTVEPNINGLDVVNRVNAFYTSAFQSTVWLLGALITLLGLAVPAAYYFLQKRQLELKEAALEKKLSEYLNGEVARLGKSLREENTQSLKDETASNQERFDALGKKINNKLTFTLGGIFMVQGNFETERKNNAAALTSFLNAVGEFAKIERLKLVQQNLQIVTADVLPGMNKGQFQDPTMTKRVDEIIGSVEKLEARGLLDEDIKRFRTALATAKNAEQK